MTKIVSVEEAFGAGSVFTPADRTSKKKRKSYYDPSDSSAKPSKTVRGELPKDQGIFAAIKSAAEEFGVPLEYGLALAQQESSYNPNAHNDEFDADGLFQYIPETARARGLKHGVDTRDPAKVARVAMQDFKEQMDKAGVDWAIKHHFAGPNTEGHGPKTSQYLADVTKRAEDIRALLGNGNPAAVAGVGGSSDAGPKQPVGEGPRVVSFEEAFGSQEAAAPAQENKLRVAPGVSDFVADQFGPTEEDPNGSIVPRFFREPVGDAIGGAFEHVKNRVLTDFGVYDESHPNYRPTKAAADPFAESRAIQERKDAPTPEAVDREAPWLDRFLNAVGNPIEAMTSESLPANLLEGMAGANDEQRASFLNARKILMQQNIVDNPDKFPSVSVEAAQAAIDERKAKQEPTVRKMWDQLVQAAKEDPATFGGQLTRAIVADPELLATPLGLGTKVIRGTRAGLTGRQFAGTANKAAKIADRIIDAGSTGAAMNLAIEAASAGADTTRELTSEEAAFAALAGGGLSGPFGIFFRGSRARSKLKSGELTPDDLESALRDTAREEILAEEIATAPHSDVIFDMDGRPIPADARQRIEVTLGISKLSPEQRKAWHAARQKELAKTFKENWDEADYLKFKAEERMLRTQQLAEDAEGRIAAERAAAEQERAAGELYARDNRAHWQSEYDKALAARDQAEAAGMEDVAAREDQLRTAAARLDEEEIIEAAFKDTNAVRNAMLRAAQRDRGLRVPKWQRGAIDPRLMMTAGLGSAGAFAGAAMFPQDRIKGALAGAMLAGLGLGRGSRSRRGAPSRISQEGAVKLKGGNWDPQSIHNLNPDSGDYYGELLPRVVQRYLNKYAGTSNDPLNDVILPSGTRWEDATDLAIRKHPKKDVYGADVHSFGPHADLNTPQESFDFLTEAGSHAMGQIRAYMNHVGDYLQTLPESEVAKMDFVRMVKETVAWDEANAKKMKNATVKNFKDAEVLKKYDDGFSWIRLNKPGQFANESDLMGHSVRGYEPTKTFNPVEVSDEAWEELRNIFAKYFGEEDLNPLDIPDKDFIDVVTELSKEVPEAAKPLEDWISKTDYSKDWIPESIGGHADYGHGGWRAIREGLAEVYSLRDAKGKPYVTIEVDAKTINPADHEVTQIKGPRNQPVNPKYAAKVDDLIDTLGIKISSYGDYDYTRMIAGDDPMHMGGSVSPEHLARLGVVAGGAAAGFALFPSDQKLQGAFLGGLAGLITPAGGSVLSKMRQAGMVSMDGDLMGINRLVAEGKLKADVDPASVKTREAEVVQRAKQGDTQAFEEIFKEHYPRVVRQINKKTRSIAARTGVDAEEIAQEVFIDLYKNLDKLPDDVNLGAWIYTIAQRKAVDSIRSAQTLKGGADVQTTSMYAPSTDQGPGSLAAGHILDEESGAIKGSVEAAAADVSSPEAEAIRQQSENVLINAIRDLSDRDRLVFLLSKVEQHTAPEIAQMMGESLANVEKILTRTQSKVLEAVERGFKAKKVSVESSDPIVKRGRGRPRKQAGEIDPRLLKVGGLATLGAGVGAYLNEENKLLGAGIGALAPVLLASKGNKGRTMGKVIVDQMDEKLGVISTRIMNKSVELWRRAIEHERIVLRDTHKHLQAVDPFLVRLQRLPANTRDILSRAILTGKPEVTNRLLNQLGDQELIASWKRVRSTLDSLGDQLVALKRFSKRDLDYFPRVVKDVDGLLKALGKERGSFLEEAIKKADEKSIRARGTGLTDLEKSMVINNVLRKDRWASQQPGFAKNRGVEEITPELQKYYATPTESLHSYIRSAVEDIERAKFFGRDLQVIVKDKQEYTNIGESIGTLTNRLMNEGKLSPKDAEEVASLLRSRFMNGERNPGELIQGVKNLSYAGLLGNPFSAAVQLGDVVIQAYTQDIRSTLEAVVRKLTGRKIVSMKDFGLVDHIAEEFVSTSKSAKFLKAAMKFGLFRAVDEFGKDIALNAAVIRFGRLAKTEGGIMKIAQKYERALGPAEFKQLITDLQKGERSDLVNSIAFAELSRTQPITRLELPQAYLDHPDGRLLYQFKSFMIKQIDVARRDAYNEIKAGHVAKGLKNLVTLGITMGVAGTATQRIKDFLLGRDVEWKATDVPMNMLKTYGLSEYFIDHFFGVSKEEAKDRREAGDKGARKIDAAPSETTLKMFVPPYKMFDEIVTGDPKAIRYIPIVGPYLYERQKEEKARSKN